MYSFHQDTNTVTHSITASNHITHSTGDFFTQPISIYFINHFVAVHFAKWGDYCNLAHLHFRFSDPPPPSLFFLAHKGGGGLYRVAHPLVHLHWHRFLHFFLSQCVDTNAAKCSFILSLAPAALDILCCSRSKGTVWGAMDMG